MLSNRREVCCALARQIQTAYWVQLESNRIIGCVTNQYAKGKLNSNVSSAPEKYNTNRYKCVYVLYVAIVMTLVGMLSAHLLVSNLLTGEVQFSTIVLSMNNEEMHIALHAESEKAGRR